MVFVTTPAAGEMAGGCGTRDTWPWGGTDDVTVARVLGTTHVLVVDERRASDWRWMSSARYDGHRPVHEAGQLECHVQGHSRSCDFFSYIQQQRCLSKMQMPLFYC